MLVRFLSFKKLRISNQFQQLKGLVTYREENLLYDPNVHTIDRKLAIAEVVGKYSFSSTLSENCYKNKYS